ncbi:hypothetical protein E6P97_00425 [Patescibacteria group bacterium]|nr:MAG: hypothetical protein E6P97_00425 [Patescibacteria group bacterium]
MTETIIKQPIDRVFAIACSEPIIKAVMPGVSGTMAQLFHAEQFRVDTDQKTVQFTNRAGQSTSVSFITREDGTTHCVVQGLESNPSVERYVRIIHNYFVGMVLSHYIGLQYRFVNISKLALAMIFVGFTVWAGSIRLSAASAAGEDPVVAAASVVMVVGAVFPLVAIFPAIIVWPFIELVKALYYAPKLRRAHEELEAIDGSITTEQYSNTRIQRVFPGLAQSVKYYGRYTYKGLLGLVTQINRLLNKLMSNMYDESRYRLSYKYGVLKLSPYYLVQLNKRNVAWVLKLNAPYAHMYIARAGSLKHSLDGERIALEGDFAQYFDVYIATGQQVEALRLATPEVMTAMIDHARPFDIEVQGQNLILHTELKQFLDPIWIAQSLTAGDRVREQVDGRKDAPQSQQLLPSVYRVPLLESEAALTLLYLVPALIVMMGTALASRGNENALAFPLIVPLFVCLAYFLAYLFAVMVLLVLAFLRNRYSASLAGVVDQDTLNSQT